MASRGIGQGLYRSKNLGTVHFAIRRAVLVWKEGEPVWLVVDYHVIPG